MIDNRLFARLAWLFPALSITLAMLVYGFGPNRRAFPFFISESAHPSGPEGWIFMLALIFTGLLLIVTSWRLYDNTKDFAIRPKVSLVAMITGVFAGVNLFLVGIFDMYSEMTLHVITALNLFYSALVWGILIHFGIYGMNHPRSKMRLIYLGIAISSHVVMIYTMGQAALENPEALLPPLDLNQVQHWVRWAALAEYGFLISFLLLLSTYESDISGEISDSEE